jgi:predicted GNAT family acetyltransferase
MAHAITHEETSRGGAFLYMQDGRRMGELTYQRIGDRLVILDHTFVDESLRGQGLARELLDAIVGWARATQTKIRPACSYAVLMFGRDKSIADVLEIA